MAVVPDVEVKVRVTLEVFCPACGCNEPMREVHQHLECVDCRFVVPCCEGCPQ